MDKLIKDLLTKQFAAFRLTEMWYDSTSGNMSPLTRIMTYELMSCEPWLKSSYYNREGELPAELEIILYRVEPRTSKFDLHIVVNTLLKSIKLEPDGDNGSAIHNTFNDKHNLSNFLLLSDSKDECQNLVDSIAMYN